MLQIGYVTSIRRVMTRVINKQWIQVIIGLALVLIVAKVFVWDTRLLAWSPINCWHYEVDINSGRIRYTRFLIFQKVREEISDSELTRVLRPTDLNDREPEWHRVLTLSPGVGHSPHYRYHSAIAQINELALFWRLWNFTPEARHATATNLLQAWHQSEDDFGAARYLAELRDITDRVEYEQRTIEESDLPRLAESRPYHERTRRSIATWGAGSSQEGI